MKISQAGLDAIKAHEGLRLLAYPDPATGGEPWTIGYGRARGVREGQQITTDEAERFLREDLAWVEKCIADTIRVPLTQPQYDALCSLIYNIGAGGFQTSTLARKLNAGDYAGAADEFSRWDKAAGQRMAGLATRRAAERSMFLSAPGPQPAPRPAPSQQPEPQPADIYGQEHSMPIPIAPIAAALLPTLIESIPRLATIFKPGSPVAERNVAAAGAVLDIVTKATGSVNAQQAVEAIKADPVQAAAATKAVEEQWFTLTETGGGGIAGARAADAAARAEDGPWWGVLRSPSFWWTLMMVPPVYAVIGSVVGLWGTEWPPDVRAAIATAVVSLIVGGGAGYYWGQITSRNRSAAP